MGNHSGIQLQVLRLYKEFMKTARRKPSDAQHRFIDEIRTGFGRNKSINSRNISTIEFLLRKGRSQLNWMKDENVIDIYKK